jgi:hypothetical protein
MRKVIFGAIVVIGLFAIFVIGVLLPPKKHTDEINREEGDRIVNALEAYHRANQAYPPELSQLVPKFIPQIPPQHRANGETGPFQYETSDNHGAYVLRFNEAPLGSFESDACFEYDSRTQAWKNRMY